MNKLCFVFLSFAGVFLFFQQVIAEPDSVSVVITEIGAPEATGHEWIEIFNVSASSIDIAQWSFWEAGVNHRLTFVRGQDTVIESGVFAIIAQDAEQFLQDYPHVTSTVFDSAWGSLNEAGEEIGLKNEQGDFVETFTYIAARDFSLERRDPALLDYSTANWIEHKNGNTVGAKNSVWVAENMNKFEEDAEQVAEEVVPAEDVEADDLEPEVEEGKDEHAMNEIGAEDEEDDRAQEPEDVPANIVINEVVPYPANGSEWIELYNISSSSVDLNNWSLFDGVGKITSLTTTLDAFGFLRVDLSSAKLNNSGDIVVLKHENGEVVSTLPYGDWGNDGSAVVAAPKRGMAIARSGDDVFITTTLTPGVDNTITEPPVDAGNTVRSDTRALPEKKTTEAWFAASSVVINEFVSTPPKGESEFVELYNATTGWIDLGGWLLEDGSGAQTSLHGALPPYGFFVVEQPRGQLNNAGDMVTLKDPTGAVIDQVIYGSWSGEKDTNPPAPAQNFSLARIKDGSDTDTNSVDFALTVTVTKGGPNEITTLIISEKKKAQVPLTKTQSPQKDLGSAPEKVEINRASANLEALIISEIFPNPVGSDTDEFIELYNTGTSTLDIGGVLLDDVEGGSRPFVIPAHTTIEPQEFLVFEKKQTGVTLNNTTDSVRILRPDQTVIQEVVYMSAREGVSYAIDLTNNSWIWTEEMTPGDENVIDVEQSSTNGIVEVGNTEVSIPQIRTVEVGTPVVVLGIVAVKPGVLGQQYFYLVDQATPTAGVQIYMYNKQFPALEVGDVVSVVGEVSEAGGQRRIKIKEQTDISVIDHNPYLAPSAVDIADFSDELVGNLVSITGEIIDTAKKYIYVDDGTDEVQVYFRPGAATDPSALHVGDTASVVGILHHSSKEEYQVLPRQQDDIQRSEAVTSTSDATTLVRTEFAQELPRSSERRYTTVAAAGGVGSILLGIFGKLHGVTAMRWARRMVGFGAAVFKRWRG